MAASVKKKQYDIAYAKTHLKRVPLDLRLDKYNEIKERINFTKITLVTHNPQHRDKEHCHGIRWH